MGFNYQQPIGKLIYAFTVCRLDIASSIILLSQHSHAPHQIHYEAAKHVLCYLFATKHHGITYWRSKPKMCLPIDEHFGTINNEETLASYNNISNAMTLHGACNATWASDRKERRSMGGVVLMLAGGAVYYRTNLQPTIAQSSSEAEFTTMADAGKASMYICWILDKLEKPQEVSTQIIADNQGSIKITSAQQPTRRVCHVEMKHFAIL